MQTNHRQAISTNLLAAALLAATGLVGCDGSEPAAQRGTDADDSSAQLVQSTDAPVEAISHQPPRPIDFGRDIRPILSDNCYFCHGPDSAIADEAGGLRLDSYEEATAHGDHAKAAIIPGDPDNSPLMRRILSTNPNTVMPPPESHRTVTPAEAELLRRWIASGAEYTGHWAFESPQRPALPEVQDTSWGENEIDTFILAELERQGLTPSPRADKATLIRRVTLDLTGLPPTPEEVDAFLSDDSPDAYEKVVDRLLDSPRYGERMASIWLDLARYGDTNGFHHDHHRTMWPWRDWVVKAYNENKPIDQFFIEQLAGDLLPGATREQVLASGFNRNHNINDEGGALDPEYRVEAVADRVETTAAVFMALTFNCCRCHDHKYDPFTQEDYFSLFAYFNSVEERGVYGANPNSTAYPPSMMYGTPQTEAAIAQAQGRLDAIMAQAESPEAGIAQEQADWQRELFASAGIRWVDTPLTDAASSDGATLTQQPDGSVLATGTNPASDSHTYTFHTDATGLRLLRLDALADPSMGNRIGRMSNGNAVISGIEVVVTSSADPAQTQTVAFDWAWASFEQPNGDFDIFNAVNSDGDGWAVGGHLNTDPRTALFVASEAFGYEGGSEIKVTLHYRSRYSNHALGRVKLAFAQAQRVDLANLFPTVTRDWFLAGPYTEADYNTAYRTAHGPESVPYVSPHLGFGNGKPRLTHQPSFIDGNVHGLQSPQSAFYIARSIFSPIERQLDLMLGSDDGLRVYLNGEEVHANDVQRGPAAATDPLTITLRPGENTLVLKIINGAGQGSFYYQNETQSRSPGHESPLALVGADDRLPALRSRFDDQWRRSHSPAYRALMEQAGEVQQEIDALNAQRAPVLIMKELPEPTPTYVLHRGEYSSPITEDHETGEPLPPLDRHPPTRLGTELPEGSPNNRLGFARWLTKPDHPLTARVHVNRNWAMLFGTGIVKTSEDFGNQADWPSHPELLDWLAVEFVDSGWDQKQLLRLILTSATYQQSAVVAPEAFAADPGNRLLAYFPRQRLSAEMIRDQALFASGLLVETMGGPSVKPYQPAGLWREVSIPSSNTRNFVRDNGDNLYRRSLYTYWKRTAPSPQMAAFDAPTREFCVIDRGATNTPLQALVLWNDEQYLEAARLLATRTLAEREGTDARLTRLYRLCNGEAPGDAKLTVLRNALSRFLERYAESPDDAQQLLGYGEAPLPETYDPAELAAWTMIASAVLSLDETIVRD
ncbi:MAG: PSD1 and planctomycete cytochrome C domain-containing protein [Phycisphaerales bacterium JB063]